jgi:hypothetical protein
MRSRKTLLVLGLIGVLGAGLALSGCSNDDRPTPPEQTINNQYSYVQSELNDVVDESITLMASTLDMFESNSQITDTTSTGIIDDILTSSFDPDSVYSSNNWYILTTDQLSAAYGARQIDSIMFTASGATVEFSGDADGITLRHLYDYSNVNTDVSYTDYETRSHLTFSGLNTTEATISGSWTATTINQIVGGATEVRTYDIQAEVNNLVVAKPLDGWGGGCPTSGSIDFNVELSYTNGGEEASTSSWEITLTFTDGAGDWSVSDGSVSTTASSVFCTP